MMMMMICSVVSVLFPPLYPHILAVTTNSILVNWTNPEANFESIRIFCEGHQGALNDSLTIPYGSDTEALCNGLTPGGLYLVRLSTIPLIGDIDPAESVIEGVITGML